VLSASIYPCQPGFICPPGWRVRAGGVPVSPGPQAAAQRAAITHHYYVELTPEQRMDPCWDPGNATTWDAFLANGRDMELARYEGDGPPPVDNNEAGLRLWWGSRTLEGVMNHILAGEYPLLRYPHFQPPKNGSDGGDFVTRTPYPPPQLGSRRRDQSGRRCQSTPWSPTISGARWPEVFPGPTRGHPNRHYRRRWRLADPGG
jgi:hypothetical protein